MMNNLTHMWIMVFVITFGVCTVKSTYDTQPDRALNTGVRSATWRQSQLTDSGDNGDESKKEAYLERHVRTSHAMKVCVKTLETSSNLDVDVGTSDIIVMYVGSADFVLDRGVLGFQNGEKHCFDKWTSNLNSVTSITVKTACNDAWWPDYISLYVPEWDTCYYCQVRGVCPNPEECMVDRHNSRTIDCQSAQNRYCE